MGTSIRSFGVVAAVLAVTLMACGSAASQAPTPGPTAAATITPTAAQSAAPAATPNACAAAGLKTLAAGKLTIGADNPAYPPYYQSTDSTPAGSIWGLGDPTNGKGLEGATAYAVAKALGFTADQVVWTAVPFDNAIQPGPKDFDLYLSQVSYSADRAKAVDLSDGYFDVSQAVVGLKSDAISKVTTFAGLSAFKLGAPVGTTSYSYIVDRINPTQPASVYNTLDAAIQAVGAGQIDGVVVDLPTAFYITAVQLDASTIVGSLPTHGFPEHYSIVLDLGSPLTACVNAAIASIKADGSLKSIVDQWITSQGAPELK